MNQRSNSVNKLGAGTGNESVFKSAESDSQRGASTASSKTKFVPRIAVFDSGLGSLSVVKTIQDVSGGGGSAIVYYADTANFPYGSKSRVQLERIVNRGIDILRARFDPDAVVVASNTPTMVLDMADGYRDGVLVAGVRPPLADAARITKTGCMAILGTAAGIRGVGLERLIQRDASDLNVLRVDGSDLVQVVESGAFLKKVDAGMCRDAIRRVLDPVLSSSDVDVVTLSSTHLPFLLHMLKEEYPGVTFLDPACGVAERVLAGCRHRRGTSPPSVKCGMRVYTSGSCSALQDKLSLLLGVRHTVRPIY